MKKLVSVVLLLTIVMSFCVISVSAQDNVYSGDKSEEYYMISFLSGIDYWKTCYQGMEDAAGYFGVTTQYTGDTTADVAKEVAVLEQVIAKNPKGIAITCVNAAALQEPIDAAIAAGIQVVTFDSDSPYSKRAAYLSTGNEAVGAKAAHYFAEKNPGGKVALLYTVGAENTEARVAGFKGEIAAAGLDLEIVVDVNDKGDQIEAAKNMSAALQANPEITAVFCMDGVAGVAGPTAVEEAGRKDILVVAFDTDSAVLDMVKSGQISATVAQGTYSMGYWSMTFLYNLVHNLPASAVPSFVDTGVTFVEADTVDNYYAK
ncbi:MAG: substrate-binding domain-containing protein [Flexilinea sp.]